MSLYRQVCDTRPYLPCDVRCPAPYTDAWNEPCVTSCGDSRAVVYPPPVVVTFPGPILSSCPQESFVGTSAPLWLSSPFRQSNYLGAGSSFGSGISQGSGYSHKSTTYRRGTCGPC
ncbi:beta-keratin-related protein-like [Rhea pennata]|uniref:beta-keratin-related protein-like n=1 Tax=Rhea pennata TaxID=8795 RepID=UPI002E2534E1